MSHADRILSELKHAPASGWVSTSELLRAVPCIVHSRISDLRKRGHLIEHRTIGVGAPGSQYRLVAALEESGVAAGGVEIALSRPRSAGGPLSSSALEGGSVEGDDPHRAPISVDGTSLPPSSASTPKDHPAGTEGAADTTPAEDAPELIPGQLSLA